EALGALPAALRVDPRRGAGRLPHAVRSRVPRRVRAAARAAAPREGGSVGGTEVTSSPTPLDVAVASRSELGQRRSNEDNVRICRAGDRWVAIVADGAGGHRGGAEASRRAVDALEAALCADGTHFDADALTAGVLAAHADVFAAAQRNVHGAARMHSTVVVLWIDLQSASALWSHVGDSRL